MAEVEPTEAERLHHLFMELIRAGGLLQPDQAVPGHGITMSQAFALHELDSADPLSQQELADRLRLEKSSVSRMAAEMERKGLLVRERVAHDQRQYRLRLTDLGRAMHAGMAGAFHQQFEEWAAAMTDAERAALLTGLPALVRAIRQHSATAEGFRA